MALDSADIANGVEIMPDIFTGYQRPHYARRQNRSDTWAPVAPITIPDEARTFADPPERPRSVRRTLGGGTDWLFPIAAQTLDVRHHGPAEVPHRLRRVLAGGTDWLWLALPQLQDHTNNPPPRRLAPRRLQGGEVSPPALFEMDAAVIVISTIPPAPVIAQRSGDPRHRVKFAVAETVQPWPPQTGAERCVLFTISPDPVRSAVRLNPPPAGEVVPVAGVTFGVFLAPGQTPDGNRYRARAHAESGTIKPMLVTQAEIQDWHVPASMPTLRAWRPARPDVPAETNGGYFSLLVPTLDLSWWTRDELPRWIRPRRTGSHDVPTLPDTGGNLAVTWDVPTQTPKRMPAGPSRLQAATAWDSCMTYIVFGDTTQIRTDIPGWLFTPFWITAAGVYQAGAPAGKVL